MIHEKVMALCNEKNIPVYKLEKECGLGNATISGWKTGSPTVKLLKRVADYFGVTLDYLVSDDPQQ